MHTILLISPYWKEPHRWMVSSVKLAELWQRLGYRVVVLCMGRSEGKSEIRSSKLEGNSNFKIRNSKIISDFVFRASNFSTEVVSPTLTIHRVRDVFLPDPWNYGIAFGFSGYAKRIAGEIKPDIIVVNKVLFWSSIATIRLRLAGYKLLLLTDALVGITWWPRGTFAKICSAIYAWTLGWLVLKAAHRVVFFHPQPPHILKHLGIAKKSEVIPTGINSTNYKLPTTNSYGQPQATSHKPQAITITYIGRLESVKGVDDFVAAALKVKREHAHVHVQVVGWYREHHPLVERHKEHITFTGLRDDIPAILASTDIFVMPSYSEGLSNAIMEAMASGCAVVASDVGGNRFLIENGVSGFLFPAGDRGALASHIRRLIEDPAKRRQLGQAARRRIEEHFDWKHIGEQYQKIFEQVLAKDEGTCTL